MMSNILWNHQYKTLGVYKNDNYNNNIIKYYKRFSRICEDGDNLTINIDNFTQNCSIKWISYCAIDSSFSLSKIFKPEFNKPFPITQNRHITSQITKKAYKIQKNAQKYNPDIPQLYPANESTKPLISDKISSHSDKLYMQGQNLRKNQLEVLPRIKIHSEPNGKTDKVADLVARFREEERKYYDYKYRFYYVINLRIMRYLLL